MDKARHDELARQIGLSIIKPIAIQGGDETDMLILLESVVLETLLAISVNSFPLARGFNEHLREAINERINNIESGKEVRNAGQF